MNAYNQIKNFQADQQQSMWLVQDAGDKKYCLLNGGIDRYLSALDNFIYEILSSKNCDNGRKKWRLTSA